jgi:cobalt-zinc-cadmium efflux system outer membrane protein
LVNKYLFCLIRRNAGFTLAAFLSLLFSLPAFSDSLPSDTEHLTLHDAEARFLKENVQLLAQKCNVDAARAQVLQNRLWDNPTVSVNQSVYNTESDKNGASKWLPVSDNGETSVQAQQLITIAGKRNKRISMAEYTAQKTEYLFFDLLRTLKYQLRSDFFKLVFTQEILKVYTLEIESISKLIATFKEQYNKGYVSKKELLRLKASLFSLESEKLALDNQLVDTRADFLLLLHEKSVCPVAVANVNAFNSTRLSILPLTCLIDTALLYRSDCNAAMADVRFNKVNLDYQKSLAIPDLQIVAGWDKNGSYVHNYNYLGVQMDVPFFNRNQGNIKSAEAAYQASQYNYQSARDQVTSDVAGAYAKAMQTEELYGKFDAGFSADFASLREEVLKNYEKRNISLIEFLDFYDAYKQNVVQFNTLQNNRANAFEGVNYSVGTNIISW